MKTVNKSDRLGVMFHCSGTPINIDFTIDSLYQTHVGQNGWSSIGYHAYIRLDGTIYWCRPLDKSGAHAKGYNVPYFGVCLEGGYKPVEIVNGKLPINWLNVAEKWDKPTRKQLESTLDVLTEINEYISWKDLKIKGHYEVDENGKTCPNFMTEDLKKWLKDVKGGF